MNFWKSNRELRQRVEELETRASTYSDLATAQLLDNAGAKSSASPSATAALEAVSGLTGRAFASAEIDASEIVVAALTPDLMNLIGRSLTRLGELILLIDVNDGRLSLLPAASCDVAGGANPLTWRYSVTVGAPDSTETYSVGAEGVVHLRYSYHPSTPWRGQSPLQVAKLAGRLSSEIVKALADEVSGPRGHLLPTPMDGQDPTLELMKKDIRETSGNALLVEGGDMGAPGEYKTDWKPQRLGANPPSALVELADLARREVFSACGVNPAIFTDSQGTAQRESYRQYLFGTCSPIGRMVASELSAKLETPVAFDWSELRASDIASRARAFASMVTAGKPLEEAAALSGLLVDNASS